MSAVISACQTYRYDLRRGGYDPMPFVMLNPSTADANSDDPTIRRCLGFAKRENKNGIVVRNLYARRTKDPAVLFALKKIGHDIVGAENDTWLRLLGEQYPRIVCAWGANAEIERVKEVVAILNQTSKLVCFGQTKTGQPRHPLYLKADIPLVEFDVELLK